MGLTRSKLVGVERLRLGVLCRACVIPQQRLGVGVDLEFDYGVQVCDGEEYKLHKPHGLSAGALISMVSIGLGQSQKKGIGIHCKGWKGNSADRGKGKPEGRGRGRSRRNISRCTFAYNVARRAAPRRGCQRLSGAITKSSCIPLGAARLSDRSERPKSPRTLENS